jgi:hypothetical protein
LKNLLNNWAGRVTQGEGLEFKPQYCKKKKKKSQETLSSAALWKQHTLEELSSQGKVFQMSLHFYTLESMIYS